MDWKSLTSKLDPLKAKFDPFIEKAKDAGIKTLDFTQRQMQNTPLVLKTEKDLDALRDKKRLIVITYDQADPLSREILLRAPVWATRAWSDAAELRFIEKSASPDIVSSLGITTPVDMHVWYIGELTAHLTDTSAIVEWWKTRCYDGKTGEKSQVGGEQTKTEPITPLDPLTLK